MKPTRRRSREARGTRSSVPQLKFQEPETTVAAAMEFCRGLDTPIALGLYLRLKYGEYHDACTMSIKASDYLTSDRFRLDYQVVSLLKKYPFELKTLDRRGTAIEGFHTAERLCKETNQRIKSWRQGSITPGPVHAIIHRMQVLCAKILGDVDPVSVLYGARFGPGADSASSQNRVSAYDKLNVDPECTIDARPLVHSLIRSVNGFNQAYSDELFVGPPREVKLKVVKGNRITLVPKSAKTDRVIAIEPHMNVVLQLGVGFHIRQRLRRGFFSKTGWGTIAKAALDLDQGQPVNQALAREGSLTNALATVDMSMASDTVSLELVREVLPENWFVLLDALRSKVGQLPDGSLLWYEKFSSMGNGFTFELETLLFWVMAISCCEYLNLDCFDSRGKLRVVAYGDDVILPSDAAELFYAVLKDLGFIPNVEKSYTSGDFRESCGMDYFKGTNVRPYFHKEVIRDFAAVFRMANGILRAAHRSCAGSGLDSRYQHAWIHLVSRVPKHFRKLSVPFAYFGKPYGDSLGFIRNLDEVEHRCVYAKGIQTPLVLVTSMRLKARTFYWRSRNQLWALLYLCRNGRLGETPLSAEAINVVQQDAYGRISQSIRGDPLPSVKTISFLRDGWMGPGLWY